jgi:mono/diheme cytochrome c family protein
MIMNNRPAAFAALVLTLAAPMLFAGLAGAQSATGNGLTGQQLYFEHGCYGCHGYTGETGERVLVGSGILSSEEIFITFLRLRAEQSPLTPSTRMPNYSQQSLSDADARKLYAYIRTFRSNAPALEDIPVFKAILDAATRP